MSVTKANKHKINAVCMQMRISESFQDAMVKGGDERRKAFANAPISLDEVTLGDLMKIPSNITPMDFNRACSELINAEKERERGSR